MMKKRTKLRRVSQRWIFIQTLSKVFLLLIFTQYLFWCLREYTDVNVYLNIIQKLSNIHAIFILIFKRRIKLFWVVGCKLWPGGGQPFQQIWPKFATKIKYPWQFDLKYRKKHQRCQPEWWQRCLPRSQDSTNSRSSQLWKRWADTSPWR